MLVSALHRKETLIRIYLSVCTKETPPLPKVPVVWPVVLVNIASNVIQQLLSTAAAHNRLQIHLCTLLSMRKIVHMHETAVHTPARKSELHV